MTLALNKPKLDNLANEVWKSAERLRGKIKAYEYQNVILPILLAAFLSTNRQLYSTYSCMDSSVAPMGDSRYLNRGYIW
jgi:hypothetical protein